MQIVAPGVRGRKIHQFDTGVRKVWNRNTPGPVSQPFAASMSALDMTRR